MGQEFYGRESGRLISTVEFDVDLSEYKYEKLEKAPIKSSWIYRRYEGMEWTTGLGFMWEHKSRGFLLVLGKVYLWVRYSGRVKKLFVRCGVQRTETILTGTLHQ